MLKRCPSQKQSKQQKVKLKAWSEADTLTLSENKAETMVAYLETKSVPAPGAVQILSSTAQTAGTFLGQMLISGV